MTRSIVRARRGAAAVARRQSLELQQAKAIGNARRVALLHSLGNLQGGLAAEQSSRMLVWGRPSSRGEWVRLPRLCGCYKALSLCLARNGME